MINVSKISGVQSVRHATVRNGELETPFETQHGTIIELFPDTGYGRIRTQDGQQVHFHRTSIAPGNNDELEPGQEVRFIAIPGAEGTWADNIQLSH